MTKPWEHTSVLLPELVQRLEVRSGGRYIDCTLGAAGHAEAVLEGAVPGGRLLGLDADPHAIAVARERLERFGGAFAFANRNFVELEAAAEEQGFDDADGVYFDLGLSSMQLAEPGRGFSFLHDDPLDMRFSPSRDRTAADLVNEAPVEELARVIYEYGEEPKSRSIARRIEAARPVRSTAQLAEIVRSAAPGPQRHIHPATRTFQALRIWVNDELGHLQQALDQAIHVLKPGGRIAVISFHSLEDRIVKDYFKKESTDCICLSKLPICVCGHVASLRRVTRKVIQPGEVELRDNPRSRSAKLRVAEKA